MFDSRKSREDFCAVFVKVPCGFALFPCRYIAVPPRIFFWESLQGYAGDRSGQGGTERGRAGRHWYIHNSLIEHFKVVGKPLRFCGKGNVSVVLSRESDNGAFKENL
jgi:hypothetical protein